MNKLMVMLPLLCASRKLDSNDEKTIELLRYAYGGIQSIILILVVYLYWKAKNLKSSEDGKKTIYVPPPKQPFQENDKKHTEVNYGEHVMSAATSLIGSTLFGIMFTLGMHVYRGAIIGLAMQIVMGPIGLFESPLMKLFIFRELKAFDEKTKEDLLPEDQVEGKTKTIEDLLLDTWDMGTNADVTPLLKELSTNNVNYATKQNQWTPLMILSGLGSKEGIIKCKRLGVDPIMVDAEGWNALHWAAFHGSLEATKTLLLEFDGMHLVKDKEGHTPIYHATKEGNQQVELALDKLLTKDEGLRKRK